MFWTRTEVATRLGITYSGVNYLVKMGKLRPRPAEPNEVMTFDAKHVEAYASRRRRRTRKPMPALRLELSGEICARVFELVEQGKHPVDIVQIVKAHPDAVMNLVERYESLKKRDDSAEEPPRCVKCGLSAARFCGGCLPSS